MRRSEFMARLSATLPRVLDAELAEVGRTSADCPYLDHWLAYYREQPPERIERVVKAYAAREAGTAEGYLEAIAQRARAGVRAWKRTGAMPTAPSEAADSGPALQAAPLGAAARTADADPAAVAARLGAGRPLEGGTRSSMESTFDTSLGEVRVHSGPAAAGLAHELSARAFAVGRDVAFGEGEYRPGTVMGDALLAHEVAHTIQQRASTRSLDTSADGALEQQADTAATAAVARIAGLETAPVAVQRGKGLKLQRCKDPAPTGPQPTLSEARASGTTLPTRQLLEMDVATLFGKSDAERRAWYVEGLGVYERQLRESAAAQRIPVQLLAAVILNEMADIDWRDLAQSDLAVTKGSLGVAQIQIDTAMRDNLFPDLTAAEGERVYDQFVDSQRYYSSRVAARMMRTADKERRLAINRRLQVPQHAIDAAAREIRLLLDRMIANPGAAWQTSGGFTHTGLAPGADPQTIYAGVAGAGQREKEQRLTQQTTAAYNSPDIIIATNPSTYRNATIHGSNSRLIAADLFDFGLYRP